MRSFGTKSHTENHFFIKIQAFRFLNIYKKFLCLAFFLDFNILVLYQIYFNLFYFFKGGRLYNQNKLWNILYLSDFMSVGQKTAGINSMLSPAKPGLKR